MSNVVTLGYHGSAQCTCGNCGCVYAVHRNESGRYSCPACGRSTSEAERRDPLLRAAARARFAAGRRWIS